MLYKLDNQTEGENMWWKPGKTTLKNLKYY
jgi:hypothetical protein